MFLYPLAVEHVANAGNGGSSCDAPEVTLNCIFCLGNYRRDIENILKVNERIMECMIILLESTLTSLMSLSAFSSYS